MPGFDGWADAGPAKPRYVMKAKVAARTWNNRFIAVLPRLPIFLLSRSLQHIRRPGKRGHDLDFTAENDALNLPAPPVD